MKNEAGLRCDVEVRVDGLDQGTYRLDAFGGMTLECPGAKDKGRFTFFRSSSDAGRAAGADAVSRDDRGLVQATFRYEKPRRVRPAKTVVRTTGFRGGASGQSQSYGSRWQSDMTESLRSVGTAHGMDKGVESGVTGLTGHSDQQFRTVSPLDYDPDNVVVVSLRLIASDDQTVGVRPLPGRTPPAANPVPAPAE
jgi:hypothetical protein